MQLVVKGNPRSHIRALNAAAGLASTKGPLPMLANILVRQSGTECSFTATNLESEVTVKTDLGAAVGSNAFCVSADKFGSILGMIDSAEMRLEVSDQTSKAVVKFGKSKFTLQAQDGKDFPEMAFGSEVTSTVIPAKQLRHLLAKASDFVAIRDIRYVLQGILVSNDAGGAVTAVATDGHRLGACMGDVLEGPSFRFVIHAAASKKLIALLPDDETVVSIEIGSSANDTKLRASFGNVSFLTKLIGEKYPDWQRIIPKPGERKVSVKVPTSGLLSTLSRMAVLGVFGLDVEVKGASLRLSCNDSESRDAAEEVVEVERNGTSDDASIAIPLKHLYDAVKAVEGESVELLFGAALESVLIKSGEGKFVGIIAPIRI